jgi:signal transduction histidine kinase
MFQGHEPCLIGLEERVGVLGGQFVACASPDGGFLVSAKLPT